MCHQLSFPSQMVTHVLPSRLSHIVLFNSISNCSLEGCQEGGNAQPAPQPYTGDEHGQIKLQFNSHANTPLLCPQGYTDGLLPFRSSMTASQQLMWSIREREQLYSTSFQEILNFSAPGNLETHTSAQSSRRFWGMLYGIPLPSCGACLYNPWLNTQLTSIQPTFARNPRPRFRAM